MNFEEFKQQLMEDLKEALSRRVGTEVAVEENEVQKQIELHLLRNLWMKQYRRNLSYGKEWIQ